MRGLLADSNVEGHLRYCRRILESLELWNVMEELQIEFTTLSAVGLSSDPGDRTLWNFCQQHEFVLLTEDRNKESVDSLEATLADSWQPGHLPVLTLANKEKFGRGGEYAEQVATDIAELLFAIEDGDYRDQPRIWVPM